MDRNRGNLSGLEDGSEGVLVGVLFSPFVSQWATLEGLRLLPETKTEA